MRIPSSTYRLQFNPQFTFKDALAIVDYLSELGISDIYASPIFCARSGSIHGYDVVDPTRINPEIGTEQEFMELIQALGEKKMGWLQDIVPNHMAYDGQNPMLTGVFENGTLSKFYSFFDVEWDHAYASMRGRLLAPFLGKPYGESLESGEIRISYGEKGFAVNYYSLQYPIRIESYPGILSPNLNMLRKQLGPEAPDYIKLVGIIFALNGFLCQGLREERADQIRFIKAMIWELYNDSPPVREFIDRNLVLLNGEAGTSDFNAIDQLLYEQFFRLSYWKVASEEINYRRFFSINELISVRMEEPEVFEHCHSLIFKMVSEEVFTGLRVDHVDGLYDPLQYLQRLKDRTKGTYVVVEKILGFDENLPPNWPVQGTSGYDYLNYSNGLFCRKDNENEFDRIYSSFAGHPFDREDLLHDKKALIVEHFMTGDVDNLANMMKRISSKDRGGGDITLHGLRRAIFEVLSFFPVYRTYVSPDSFTGQDRRFITEAVHTAKGKNPDLTNEINYLAKFLLLKYQDYLGEEEKKAWLSFVMRFQQFCGPLMAKGFEDTLFYVYNRLASLNEVGGDPFRFGVSVEEFHEFNRGRSENWPHTMNATSTHDTKRGEDARARINVLSEIPGEWEEHLKIWREHNAKRKSKINNRNVPAANDEYFLYQNLVGTWPFDESQHAAYVGRMKEYMIKAIREAKVYTDWIKPDTDYEKACEDFIEKILDTSGENEFLADFMPFQQKIAHFGVMNSISQLLLKICSTGIPDFYRGAELWELSLVDPDNRRPVDYGARISLLEQMKLEHERPDFLRELMATAHDGRIKLFVTWKCLIAIKLHRNLFRNGSYIPLPVEGEFAENVVAFAREENSEWAIAIAPRFCTVLAGEKQFPLGRGVWRDTLIRLPEGAPQDWMNEITSVKVSAGNELFVGSVLSDFPICLLTAGGNHR
jgi:(1->4)-alpha-D-glucan 1-alpha-D-glucosylmutase